MEAFSPDVVLINLANPHRDELEESFALSRAMARPVAMFVDQSDIAGIEAAIDAGVSAYVVDGLKKQRNLPILEVPTLPARSCASSTACSSNCA